MQAFLASLKDADFSVVRSSEFRLTKSGNGYNFTIRSERDRCRSAFFRVYFHCPNHAPLKAGNYLVCYRKSARVLDRLDAFAIIEERDFIKELPQEIADARWRESFFHLSKECSWVKQQLESQLYAKLVEAYEQENTPALKGELSVLASGLHLESFPDVVALLEGKLNGIGDISESFDFKTFESQLSDKLKSLLVLGIQNSFETHLSETESYIDRKFLKTETQLALIEYLTENSDRLGELSDAVLKFVVSSDDFCPDIDKFKEAWIGQGLNKRTGLTSKLNDALLPHFLDELPVSKLADFLLLGVSKESYEARNKAVSLLLTKLGTGSYNQSILSEKVQQALKQADTAIAFRAAIRSYSSDAVELIKLAYSSRLHQEEVSQVVVDALVVYKNPEALSFIKGLPDELVLSNINDELVSLSGNDYLNFLEQFAYLGTEKIIGRFDSELLPLFASYASENQFIEYLCYENRVLAPENQAILKEVASSKNYCEAKLLVTLYETKSTQRSVSAYQIVNVLSDFQTELFNYHAVDKTKIDLKTFPPCARAIESFKYRGMQTQISVCEGKLINVREPNEGEDDYYVLCKRSKCTDSKICSSGVSIHAKVGPHSQYSFYSLVFRLFQITPRDLHSNDQFVRIVSALNRWNVILKRLFCECCKSPLAISEHSRDSMGKMAVGTTYWHCSNNQCQEYAKSVKISYCIDCRKVIDNRIDKRSCTPYKIRSYEKFYICSKCASCCSRHAGNAGVCPNCGIEAAYKNVKQEKRTKATCRNCSHEVSISPFGFKAILKHQENGGAYNHIRPLTSGTCHLIAALPATQFETRFFVETMPWNNSILYVYDLLECLRAGYINPDMLVKYDQVYDIKILEKMAWLGENHRKYGTSETSKLTDLLIGSETTADFRKVERQFIAELNRVFNRVEQQSLWGHYTNVEKPFVIALHNLLGDGIVLDKKYIESEIHNLEVQRNRTVQSLLNNKVYHSDDLSTFDYLKNKYPQDDAEALYKMLQAKGPSALKDIDEVFEYRHQVEKLEKAAVVATSLVGMEGNLRPMYDSMGTVTGRCTSKKPALMNLPKVSRHIIQPERGMVIAECDYKQMEIGVLAGLSQDEVLIEDFNTGDVYQRFAELNAISREQAKTLVLGLLYGMSTSTLATLLRLEVNQASQLLDKFFSRYQGVKSYQAELVRKGRELGYVESVSGLRRFTNQKVMRESSLSHWEANWYKNFPVQSSAASIFKESLIDLADQLVGQKFKLVVPHYDAIVFQVPTNEFDIYATQVRNAMFRAMKKRFQTLEPVIDIKVGEADSWGAPKQVL